MVQNFLLGAGVKLLANVVNNFMANRADEHRANMLKDELIIKAHVELARETNKDVTSKICRSFVFIMFTASFCFMGIWGVLHPDSVNNVLIPMENGWLGKMFNQPTLKPIDHKGSVLIYQWWQLMEMIIGSYVVPSRRR